MAGSTYSSNLKIELMATGENSGTWGDITNTNLGTALEQAVIGLGTVDYVADANLTISITNSNASQAARALVLNVTSSLSLTATRELVVPTIQKQYIVQNNTTGGQSITVKTSAGTGITVPNGRKAHLYVNGTDVIQMFDFVDINGGTIDGATVGASSASSGAFTTLTASGATTLNGAVALGDASGDAITVPGTISSNLLFTDNTYDIGASGATRPRNLYLAGAATIGGNLSVGGTLTLTGGLTLNGNVTVGDSSSDTLTINSTITSNLIFTDNTYDIGASGATRPRNLFLAGNATIGGNQTLTGSLTVDSTTDSSSTTTGSIQTDGGLGVAKALFVGTTANIASTVWFAASSTSTDSLNVNGFRFGAGTFKQQYSAGFDFQQYYTAAGQSSPDASVTVGSGYYALKLSGTERARLNSTGQFGVGLTAINNNYLIQSNSGVSAGTSIVAQGSLQGYTGAGIFMSYESTYGRLEAYDYATSLWKNIGIAPNGGYVGFGTATPATKVDIRGTSASVASTVQIVGNTVSTLLLGQNADGGVIRGQGGNNVLSFWTGGSGDTAASGSGSERMRITSAGNLTVGYTNADILGGGTTKIGAFNYNTNCTISAVGGNYTTANYAQLYLSGGYGDGGTRTSGFFIRSQATGGGGNVINELLFVAQTANGGSESERMRISNAGYVGMGTNSPARPLEVAAAVSVDTTGSTGKWTASFRDLTATAAAGVGGSLLFQGLKSTAGSVGNFGAIAGLKENSTNGNEDGYLAFFTVPNSTGLLTERARITSTGQLLVGNTTTSGGEIARFQTDTTSGSIGIIAPTNGACYLNFGDTSDANVGFIGYEHNSNYMNFRTNGSEALRITSPGNVCIGTSSDTIGLSSLTAKLVVQPASVSANQIAWAAKFQQGSYADNAITALGFSVEASYTRAAFGYVRGTAGYDVGSFAWYLASASSVGTTVAYTDEKMRLDYNGYLLLGKTTYGASGGISFNPNVSGLGFGRIVLNSGYGAAANSVTFEYNGSQVGFIQQTTTATSYNTSSDYRLKENIQPITGALAFVRKQRPVTYNWKADGSKGVGYVAHWMQEDGAGNCVTGEKDSVDADGKPQYQGIDTSFMVAPLNAAINELAEMFDALKAEFDAYKASHP